MIGPGVRQMLPHGGYSPLHQIIGRCARMADVMLYKARLLQHLHAGARLATGGCLCHRLGCLSQGVGEVINKHLTHDACLLQLGQKRPVPCM